MGCKFKVLCFTLLGILVLSSAGCRRKSTAHTAFYFWKTSLQLDQSETSLLSAVGANHLYVRFFDVDWNDQHHEVLPNAVLEIRRNVKALTIVPVVFITNRTFEHVKADQTDSLAFKVSRLLGRLAEKSRISYQSIQVDCDWSLGTRAAYFAFLKSLKKYSSKKLEATIRLHQVKYAERTGIPPVDKGILMFYNMGQLSPNLNARNSIYNSVDAEKYIQYLSHYTLPLDVALPLFSWSIQIRGDKIIKLYGKISRKELSDKANFEGLAESNAYRARKSFYINGIYVKTQDVFKLEDINADRLVEAAKQASKYLLPLKNRNIIYYEISSVNLTSVYASDIQEASAYF